MEKALVAQQIREFLVEHGANILGGKPVVFRVHPTQLANALAMFHASGWNCVKTDGYGCSITVLGQLSKE